MNHGSNLKKLQQFSLSGDHRHTLMIILLRFCWWLSEMPHTDLFNWKVYRWMHKKILILWSLSWYLFNTLTCYPMHSNNVKMSSKAAAELFKFPCWSSNCKLDCAVDSFHVLNMNYPTILCFIPLNISLGWNTSTPEGFGLESPHCIPLLLICAFSTLPVVSGTLFWISSITWTSRHKPVCADKVKGEFFGGPIY